MKKLLGLVLIVGGVALAFYGWTEYRSAGDKILSFVQGFSGGFTENRKNIGMMVAGAMSALAGGALIFLRR